MKTQYIIDKSFNLFINISSMKLLNVFIEMSSGNLTPPRRQRLNDDDAPLYQAPVINNNVHICILCRANSVRKYFMHMIT